jgi:hypothetical protein
MQNKSKKFDAIDANDANHAIVSRKAVPDSLYH